MFSDLDPSIISSLITGFSTIIASVIAVSGAYVIITNRKTVIKLCEQVEAYYELEEWLVKTILELQKKDTDLNSVRKWKGVFRTDALGAKSRPEMTKQQAKKIKKRYFG